MVIIMKLMDFLKNEKFGMSQQRLGELVGVSQAAINRYANGERFPSPVMIKKLEKATGNRVKVKDWYEGVTAEVAE